MKKLDFVVNSNSIPFEKAIELCVRHRKKHKVRLLSQCWGCALIILQKIVAANLLIDFLMNWNNT